MPIYIVDSCSSLVTRPYTVPAYSLSFPTEFGFSNIWQEISLWYKIFDLHVIADKKLTGLDTYGTRFSAFHIFSSGLHPHASCTACEFLTNRLYL